MNLLRQLNETMLRYSQGNLSPEAVQRILDREFDLHVNVDEIAPLTSHLNRALQDVSPDLSVPEQEKQANKIWERFVAEITHIAPRPIPPSVD